MGNNLSKLREKERLANKKEDKIVEIPITQEESKSYIINWIGHILIAFLPVISLVCGVIFIVKSKHKLVKDFWIAVFILQTIFIMILVSIAYYVRDIILSIL